MALRYEPGELVRIIRYKYDDRGKVIDAYYQYGSVVSYNPGYQAPIQVGITTEDKYDIVWCTEEEVRKLAELHKISVHLYINLFRERKEGFYRFDRIVILSDIADTLFYSWFNCSPKEAGFSHYSYESWQDLFDSRENDLLWNEYTALVSKDGTVFDPKLLTIV